MSKKKKPVLVQELRNKKYEAFPTGKDARKAGETDDVVENNDDVAADEDGGARDYDYLLGLPIWSLTQERVDKLHLQMVNKQAEIDTLKAKSEKDLWVDDLDKFVEVWDTREKEEREIVRKIRGTARRGSKKIGIGSKTNKTTSRMKAADEDDFAPAESKATKAKAAKASAAKGIVKVETAAPSSFFQKQKPKPKPSYLDGSGNEDGLSDDDFATIAQAPSRAPSEQPAGGRNKRAAAAKPKAWIEEEDEETASDDDKYLGDIGDMVKGIGNTDTTKEPTNFGASGRVSLYGMSRPGSSSGRPSSSSDFKAKSKSKAFEISDDDETNYEMLAKSSPHKSAPAKDNLDSFLSDDDSMAIAAPPPKKAPVPKAKPALKPKKTLVPKKATIAAVPEAAKLSPAAKAYAAKQTKMKLKPISKLKIQRVSDDEEDVDMDDLADDLDKDDEEDSPPPRAAASRRPARVAVAKPKAKAYVELSDDDNEMDVDEQDEESEEDFDDSD